MQDLKDDLAYYKMAKELGIKPWQVDMMPAVQVDTMLTFIDELEKKQNIPVTGR